MMRTPSNSHLSQAFEVEDAQAFGAQCGLQLSSSKHGSRSPKAQKTASFKPGKTNQAQSQATTSARKGQQPMAQPVCCLQQLLSLLSAACTWAYAASSAPSGTLCCSTTPPCSQSTCPGCQPPAQPHCLLQTPCIQGYCSSQPLAAHSQAQGRAAAAAHSMPAIHAAFVQGSAAGSGRQMAEHPAELGPQRPLAQ
jgi:hypothetical protein